MAMNQNPHRVKILDAEAVRAKLRRMAYEIFEKNYEEEAVVMIGLGQEGEYLADRLTHLMQEISPLKIVRIGAGKGESHDVNLPEEAAKSIEGRVVVIVDDVLYSGLTMFHALEKVMQLRPSKVQIAVLIDRGHRHVPVSHDFVGMELATSLQQYVSVEIVESEQKAAAYLF
jgi:pyrimidine operon attenuation protein/uracil phosphoribosyltransferase